MKLKNKEKQKGGEKGKKDKQEEKHKRGKSEYMVITVVSF